MVVLGAGLYGGYCASKIYELSRTRFGASVRSGASPVTRNLVWGVGWRSNQPFVGQAYCIGGKGVYWGGWCPRLQEVDLKEWPQEVRNYLVEVNKVSPVGTRPIDHIDPATGTLLSRNEPLSGYEALEYEIGVAPSDDFVFDPAKI